MNQDTLTSIAIVALCLLAPVILVIFGFVGRAILVSKGYSGLLGFILGTVGGIIGIIIALVIPKATQPSTQSSVASLGEAPQRQVPVPPSPTPTVGVSQPRSNIANQKAQRDVTDLIQARNDENRKQEQERAESQRKHEELERRTPRYGWRSEDDFIESDNEYYGKTGGPGAV